LGLQAILALVGIIGDRAIGGNSSPEERRHMGYVEKPNGSG
jgi:hypothetical protein